MPDSPLISSEDILSFDILINGQQIKDIYEVISIELERAVFRIPIATIILALPVGSEGNQTFADSELGDFIPGVDIDIKLGTVYKKETVFRGMIVNQGIRNRRGEINELILHCSDKSAKMTLGLKSANYQDMTDSAVMGSILGDYGLSSEVESTTFIHEQLVKYQVKDWDFIVSRAEANGMLAYIENGKVSVKKPLASGIADLKVEFGTDVLSSDRISMMQGAVTFLGNAKPKLNTLLEMHGFGDRFNGNVLITSIQHSIREGLWHTTVGFGLPPE